MSSASSALEGVCLERDSTVYTSIDLPPRSVNKRSDAFYPIRAPHLAPHLRSGEVVSLRSESVDLTRNFRADLAVTASYFESSHRRIVSPYPHLRRVKCVPPYLGNDNHVHPFTPHIHLTR